ncbi:retrotransposon protein, putative, ty1-copia subclass [Tanacetum coccineum]
MGYAPVQAPPFALKPKNPLTPKKDNLAKDAICHQCGEIGHWRRNCPVYLAELMKKKKLSQGASTSGALSLYVGYGHRVAVEAIGEFHLCLPSGIVLILHNCHYAPSITRGIISVSRLYKDGFVNRFENDNSIFISKNNLIYFNAILWDDIYEIVLSSSNTNDSYMYVISNKRAKLNLDSALLWHCRLGHISKKRIEKLQHDGLLDSTGIKSFEKCVSSMSGKMERKWLKICLD